MISAGLKNKVIVDISDARFSTDPGEVLVTYSLGSCIGISLYDHAMCAGCLLHYQLPASSLDPDRARHNPFMFADTGIAILVDKLAKIGANVKRLKVKVAGGASMQAGPQGFDIGKRNYLAIRKILWQYGMFIDAEDVGGVSPRNMYLDIETGEVMLRSGSLEKKL
jgi:chemotaxis protein CheD